MEYKKAAARSGYDILAFVILSGFFIFGSVLGYSFSGVEISEFSSEGSFTFLPAFINMAAFPIAAIILGYFVFGFMVLPLVSWWCGFSVSFAAGILARSSVLSQYLVFFAAKLVSATFFLFLSVYSFSSSLSLFLCAAFLREPGIIFGKKSFIRSAAAVSILAFAALCESLVYSGMKF